MQHSFLHDISSNLPVCGGNEREPSVSDDLHQILCKIITSYMKDGVMQSITFADGHCVRHVRRASRNVQDSPGRPAHGGHVERLKPGLRHVCGETRGLGLVEGFSRDGRLVVSSVCVGKGDQQNDENGLGEEN